MPLDLNGPGHDLGVYILISQVPGYNSSSQDGWYAFDQVGETIVRFLDQPVLSESRTANYEPESLLHGMEAFNAYSGTEQRQFSISGKFFSKNNEQAEINNKVINVVRSLVMPDYNRTGSPPSPVKLYAYGSNHIAGLPCLVREYSFDFGNDVDYITLKDKGISIPVVFSLSITLIEQHSVKELRKFNLAEFRRGKMVGKGF